MTIIIPHAFTDLNTYIQQERGSAGRYRANKTKRADTEIAAWAAKAAMAQRQEALRFPLAVFFNWYVKDKRKDPDNIAFAKKFILDGFVEAGLLPNDSMKFIAYFVDRFYIGDERVEVQLVSAPDSAL